MGEMHNCPGQNIKGNDVEIFITTTGDVEIFYECESRGASVTMKFKVCPFCGISFEDV